MKNVHCDTIIIGAGAAGLFAGYLLSYSGKECLILEKNAQCGKKILISGGGRCNFTNKRVRPEHYQAENQKFSISALGQYQEQDFIDFIEQHSIDYYEKKMGQLFCKHKSKDLLELLLRLNKEGGSRIEVNSSVERVSFNEADSTFSVNSNKGHFTSCNLIIATGGLSLPSLGVSDLGYKIAKQFGHQIITPRPALVPLSVEGLGELSGVSLPVRVSDKNYRIEDDLLITHKGLSGPAILKASLYWEPGDELQVDWLPSQRLKEILDTVPGSKAVFGLLKNLVPKRLAEYLLREIKIDPNKRLADLTRNERQNLMNFIHHYRFRPLGTLGMRKAEVTKGGVSTEFVSSKNMESRLRPQLYFIGEVLDMTGLLGGYNFQWAWSSAYVATQKIIKGIS
jgi:predicted Rossmann fold flavoprotein